MGVMGRRKDGLVVCWYVGSFRPKKTVPEPSLAL